MLVAAAGVVAASAEEVVDTAEEISGGLRGAEAVEAVAEREGTAPVALPRMVEETVPVGAVTMMLALAAPEPVGRTLFVAFPAGYTDEAFGAKGVWVSVTVDCGRVKVVVGTIDGFVENSKVVALTAEVELAGTETNSVADTVEETP